MPKVLVIDDDDVVALSVQYTLREYEVLATADKVEGLDLFRRYLADIALIVLDVQMPHLDGHATCVKIRSISRNVPIILLRSSHMKEPWTCCASWAVLRRLSSRRPRMFWLEH